MDQDRPDRRRYMLPALLAIGIIALLVLIVAAVAVARNRRHHTTAVPATSAAVMSDPASWTPSTPALPGDVTTAWAYLDSAGGDMILGGDGQQHPLGQLVSPGIAADYLDQHGAASLNPHDLVMLEAALGGNTEAGQQLTDQAGGVDQVLPRIVDHCQLTNTAAGPPATATVLDMARYGACLREGALVDPDRSAWVLDQMRQTAGGIGDVRGNDGGQRLAQFNTTSVGENGRNTTNCLGVGAYWSAAVVVNWPADRGQLYGVAACAQVARDQFPPDTQKAPSPTAPTDSASASASVVPATTCPYGTCRATD
jgi:hypothetical protein